MTLRRGDVVALAAARIGFARATAGDVLAIVLLNDDLCASATGVAVAPVERVPPAPPNFPAWVVLEREAALAGRWVVMTDEIRRVAVDRLAPGARGRLSSGAMRRIDKALRWTLAL